MVFHKTAIRSQRHNFNNTDLPQLIEQVHKDDVAATASQPSPDRIVVTYYGGPDQDSVESITVMVNGLQVDDDDADTPSAIEGVDPGYSLTISSTSNMTANNGRANLNGGNLTITSGNDHVVVAATFTGDSTQVILDTYV